MYVIIIMTGSASALQRAGNLGAFSSGDVVTKNHLPFVHHFHQFSSIYL